MNTIKPFSISLEYNEFKTLAAQGPGKLVLKCLSGSGWITAQNDPNDYIVYPGRVLVFPEEQSGILMQGLSSRSKLEIEVLEGEC